MSRTTSRHDLLSLLPIAKLAAEIGEKGIQPLIDRDEDPLAVFAALGMCMGVVIHRSAGKLAEAIEMSGLLHIATFIKAGYNADVEGAKHWHARGKDSS